MLSCDEWGDKSQLTAIALAANYNPFGIVFGGSLAFFLCIMIAICIGQIVKKYFSERLLNLFGGILFLAFGIYMIFE